MNSSAGRFFTILSLGTLVALCFWFPLYKEVQRQSQVSALIAKEKEHISKEDVAAAFMRSSDGADRKSARGAFKLFLRAMISNDTESAHAVTTKQAFDRLYLPYSPKTRRLLAASYLLDEDYWRVEGANAEFRSFSNGTTRTWIWLERAGGNWRVAMNATKATGI
jgi:hypothetical protein